MSTNTQHASNVIPFPSVSTTHTPSSSGVSLMSTRATALDVCHSVYGEDATSADALDRFYEANASTCSSGHYIFSFLTMNRTYYENPFITATSRSVIGDIHRLSRQLSSVDVPRPLAVFCTLFRIQPPIVGFFGQNSDDPLFQALRVWTDVGDICESESFDGHRKAIVEHTLNVLLLPGIHCDGNAAHRFTNSSDSLVNIAGFSSQSNPHHFISPSLPIPGTSFSVPSPLHFQLRVVTRLSFNEQGLVTHHRDIWDVKDVMGLVPGVSLAQWIGTRLTAAGLSYAAKFLPKSKPEHYSERSAELPTNDVDLENGMTPTAAYVASTRNTLGAGGI
ncbi:hypothetical protein BDQ12DRAFT_596847 [Crucibulum laeve]|uniref:Uncharacterized protein n=1 Tax=Crucibulum laeve TaxID=68775 RepID=A0A5C3MRF8_9AGAR|nr:hypothetical protein BDQ12DRAFT_596847 [Crucibulum laeve]